MALIDASPIQVTHLVVAYLKGNLGDWTTALEPEADAVTGLTIPLEVLPAAIFPSIQNTYPRFPNMTVMAASTENEQEEFGNNELWEIQLDVMVTVRSNKRSSDLSAQQHMVYQSARHLVGSRTVYPKCQPPATDSPGHYFQPDIPKLGVPGR